MTGENLAALVGAYIGSCAGMIIGWFARDVLRSLRALRRRLARLGTTRTVDDKQFGEVE